MQIGTAKGAKSVLPHLAQSQDQRKTAKALEPCVYELDWGGWRKHLPVHDNDSNTKRRGGAAAVNEIVISRIAGRRT